MKGERHNKILELIQQHAIDRQEDLTGFDELGFAFAPSLSNDAVYTYVQQL